MLFRDNKNYLINGNRCWGTTDSVSLDTNYDTNYRFYVFLNDGLIRLETATIKYKKTIDAVNINGLLLINNDRQSTNHH